MSGHWADECGGPAGSPPDPGVWLAETGGGGWGDVQLQRYTTTNAVHTGAGQLALVAGREADGSSPRHG